MLNLSTRKYAKVRETTCGYAERVDDINSTVSLLPAQERCNGWVPGLRDAQLSIGSWCRSPALRGRWRDRRGRQARRGGRVFSQSTDLCLPMLSSASQRVPRRCAGRARMAGYPLLPECARIEGLGTAGLCHCRQKKCCVLPIADGAAHRPCRVRAPRRRRCR
jgi:hypothetical protein